MLYTCYNELRKNQREGTEYVISQTEVLSKICIFSPHGGGIEPGTSELVRAAGLQDFSWYLFEGIQTSDNWRLHITSHLFDEPRALAFIRRHRVAVAIHGESADNIEATYLGGRNSLAERLVRESLHATGFNVPHKTPRHLLGQEPNNICNRCATGEGIQLEITSKQRQQFFCGDLNTRPGRKLCTAAFVKYINAIRTALRAIENAS